MSDAHHAGAPSTALPAWHLSQLEAIRERVFADDIELNEEVGVLFIILSNMLGDVFHFFFVLILCGLGIGLGDRSCIGVG